MDEQDLPKTAFGVARPVGSEQSAQPGSTVVFFGDRARVAEGFAIALRAMGIGQSKQGGDPDA